MTAPRGTTLERLIELSVRRFKLETAQVAPDADMFESLGIDSVQVLELLSELELEFDIEIPDYELRNVKTFAELGKVIDRRL